MAATEVEIVAVTAVIAGRPFAAAAATAARTATERNSDKGVKAPASGENPFAPS